MGSNQLLLATKHLFKTIKKVLKLGLIVVYCKKKVICGLNCFVVLFDRWFQLQLQSDSQIEWIMEYTPDLSQFYIVKLVLRVKIYICSIAPL